MNYTSISDKITPLQLEHAMRCIYDAQSIAIITHQNPDGDAMGSSLAMRHWLHAIGKKQVTNIVPTSFPDFLAWMPGVESIIQYEQQPEAAVDAIREADLVICTDLAEANRVAALSDTLAERFSDYENCKNNGNLAGNAALLIIDHHRSSLCSPHPEQVAHHDIASASELVFRLAYQFAELSRTKVGGTPNQHREYSETILDNTREHIESITVHDNKISAPFDAVLTPDFATCIYTGMMTDTGNFSYNSCEPEMYSIVAMLLTTGINKDAIYDRVPVPQDETFPRVPHGTHHTQPPRDVPFQRQVGRYGGNSEHAATDQGYLLFGIYARRQDSASPDAGSRHSQS